jgi:hypothetical protein
MLQDFKSDMEEFRGQRWLTALLLLVLAAGMVITGFKELTSGHPVAGKVSKLQAGIIPVRLAIPVAGFEVRLAETSLNGQGQPAGPGWVKNSIRPGERVTAVIGIEPGRPWPNLKPGDRLKLTGQAGETLALEISATTGTAGPVTASKATGNQE